MRLLALAIGLILVYLVFAVVVSGLQEWWAQFRGQRGKFLRIGIARLIDDDAVFTRVLQHPLVAGLYRHRAARGKPPSYLEPQSFALAFSNVILRRSSVADGTTQVPPAVLTFPALREAVVVLAKQHSPVANALLPILDQAEQSLPKALLGIEDWFSAGMDRVSGWYKSYAQRRLFVIGLLIAVLANVDSIAIFRALNHSNALTDRLVAQAQTIVQSHQIAGIDVGGPDAQTMTPEEAHRIAKAALIEQSEGLPIGYACLTTALSLTGAGTAASELGARSAWQKCGPELQQHLLHWTIGDWLLHALGCLLTALAGVLGAPYWFAALSRVVNIRGSGPKPCS